MPKRSTIDKLPSELREQIGAYLKETRSVDEFTELVNELLEEQGSDERVSRSSAHRYMQQQERLGARLRQSQELANSFAKNMGDLSETKRVRYLASLVQELAFEKIGEAFEQSDKSGNASQSPKSLAALGQFTRHMGAFYKDVMAVEERARAAREMAEQLDAAVEEAAASGEKGLSLETVAAIKEKVLGVRAVEQLRREGEA